VLDRKRYFERRDLRLIFWAIRGALAFEPLAVSRDAGPAERRWWCSG
jgi:hypothetical protein